MDIPFVDVYKVPPDKNVSKVAMFDIFIERYYTFNISLFPARKYIVQFGVVHNNADILHSSHIFSECDNPTTYDVLTHLEGVYKKWRYGQVAVISEGIVKSLVRHELCYLFDDDEVDDVFKHNDEWVFYYAKLIAKEIRLLQHMPSCYLAPIINDIHSTLRDYSHNESLKLPYKENWEC